MDANARPERCFVVFGKAGNIIARGPAECAPDAGTMKRSGYRLKFYEGENGYREIESMIARQRAILEKAHSAK